MILIIANYGYGESNLKPILDKKSDQFAKMAFRFVVLGMVFIGSILNLKTIWHFADLSMGLMALTNLLAIVLLSPVAFRILSDYERQVKAGKTPDQITFNPDDFIKLKDEANRTAWKD